MEGEEGEAEGEGDGWRKEPTDPKWLSADAGCIMAMKRT